MGTGGAMRLDAPEFARLLDTVAGTALARPRTDSV